MTSHNLRMSQDSILPAAEFDLIRADSDRDIQLAGREERPRSGAGNILLFEPWVGGIPSSPSDVVAVPPLMSHVSGRWTEGEARQTRWGPETLHKTFPISGIRTLMIADTDSVGQCDRRTLSVWWMIQRTCNAKGPNVEARIKDMDVGVERIFSLRASVMRSVPRFLHGLFGNTMEMVVEEIVASVEDPGHTWVEGPLDVAKVIVPPPTRGQGEVGDTVRGFHSRRLGVVVGGQSHLC